MNSRHPVTQSSIKTKDNWGCTTSEAVQKAKVRQLTKYHIGPYHYVFLHSPHHLHGPRHLDQPLQYPFHQFHYL
ncbi:hypothetical protein LguiB_001832 [Lonicera macranthoides]